MRTILAQDATKINHPIFPKFSSEAGKYSEAERSVVLSEAEHSKGILPFTRKHLNIDASSVNSSIEKNFLSEASDLRESEGRSLAVLSNIEQVAAIFPKKRISKSVLQCGKFSFAHWKKIEPKTINFGKFRCKSWRCPNCANAIAHRDFTRINDAIRENPGQWLFIVLTFNPAEYGNIEKAYKAITPNSNKLLKRMEREFGSKVYIQSVEQHNSKWPHVNMLLKFDEHFFNDDLGCEKFRSRWLVKNAKESGFGKMVTCEIAKGDGSAVANYIAKTGLTIVNEVVKLSQVPMSAPIGTRRIRATKGLLAPLRKNSGENSGAIIKTNIDEIKKADNEIILHMMAQKYSELKDVDAICIIEERKIPDKNLSLFAPKPSKDFRVEKNQKISFAEAPHASLYFLASLKNYDQLDNQTKMVNTNCNLSVAH